MIKLDAAALEALPSRYRANLINGITGYKPALLVGTASAEGASNLAVFSNVFHVGASPPVLGLIVRPRPEGTERHTLDNICLLYTSPSPRDQRGPRMPSSA